MLNYDELTPGDVLSENSFSIVKEVLPTKLIVTSNGRDIEIGRKYAENVLYSAKIFSNQVKISQTDLIETLMSMPRTACTVYFRKADTPKTQKAIKEEKAAKLAAIQAATIDTLPALVTDLMENPILDYIPGEMRVMLGYHEGKKDDRGRILFIDMEDSRKVKTVDPRTLEFIIVDNKKFIKK